MMPPLLLWVRLPFQPQVDCWEPLAKWPDGKSFDEWDRYGAVELDIPSNVEINKKNGEWAADSIAERNRWRESIWQKGCPRNRTGVTPSCRLRSRCGGQARRGRRFASRTQH